MIVTSDPYLNNPKWERHSFTTADDGSAHIVYKTSHTYQANRYRVITHMESFISTLWQTCNLKKAYKALKSGVEKRKISIPDTVAFAKADGSFPKLSCAEKAEVLSLQPNIIPPNRKYEPIQLHTLDPELLPVHKIQLGEVTYYFSKPFLLDKGDRRYYCLTLIKIGDKVFTRLAYLSSSQACWRIMPFASKEQFRFNDELSITHIGKGVIESDTQLPIAINLALHDLLQDKTENKLKNAHQLVQTHNYGIPQGYKNHITINKCLNPNKESRYLARFKEQNPKKIALPPEEKCPNFTKCLCAKKFYDKAYEKNVVAKVFASHDKQWHYLFYSIDDKVFLANIECVLDNPINAYGLRKEAIDPNGMDAPLREYYEQISAKYLPSECKDWVSCYVGEGVKVSNWNFVRELPIIQLYYKQQKKKIPAKI